ncbi:MAG: excinuclease ABC subunit UvrC [Candidatus Aminicenantes bacterium]|nr:excinuclease ABC subunit UvrC [Candidatus Aminicenantes bacterium]
MLSTHLNRLRAQCENLPEKPGIYFFKDRENNIIYIGKARLLRNRVKSYFLPTSDSKIKHILRETEIIDYILTDSEKEAVFLENNYIRKYQPKFNLRLKDDKSFPYLKLTVQEDFPSISLTRKIESDGSKYFGPFHPAHQARKIIHLLNKYFGIRSCQDPLPHKRKRPCLEYDMKLCTAPCVGFISQEDYNENILNAVLFLEGKSGKLTRILKQKMQKAADNLEFEQAAHWRDFIQTIENIKSKQKIISSKIENIDIIGFARQQSSISIYVFFMRHGKVIESESLFFQEDKPIPDEEILSARLLSFYKEQADFPDKILLPLKPSNLTNLSQYLSTKKSKKIEIIVPCRGKNKQLVGLANKNAQVLLQKKQDELSSLIELKNLLQLDHLPRRIEGFDISNTGGEESVGSLVVFEDGKPKKNKYRKFKITTVKGPNDVASLKEVIQRHYTKVKKEQDPLPDIILVDGGKGQLHAAKRVLDKIGALEASLISIAKKEEKIFTASQKNGICLERTSPALKLIQNVRDEAHRFALSYHRLRRAKKSFSSILDEIPGIGNKRKAKLLTSFESIEDIKRADSEKLAQLIGKNAAKEVLKKLRTPKTK